MVPNKMDALEWLRNRATCRVLLGSQPVGKGHGAEHAVDRGTAFGSLVARGQHPPALGAFGTARTCSRPANRAFRDARSRTRS
jgi:hypothetical protein